MKILKDVYSAFRANIKCLFLKVIHMRTFYYHPYIRIDSDVNIRLWKGVITLGKGVLVSAHSVLSVSSGGRLTIGNMVGINCNSMIMCHDSISIGDNTIMGPGVYIYDHDHVFDSMCGVRRNEYVSAPVSIGRNCWIGANTVILRGTTIGDNCLIAAGCVVKGNIESGSIVVQKRETVVRMH